MATIALPRPIPAHRASSGLSLSSSSIAIDSINANPVPNKHLPVCPPGPVPRSAPHPHDNHPPTPESLDSDQTAVSESSQSILFPPDAFPRLGSADGGSLVVYQLTPRDIANALDHIARQPLPDPSAVFPWLHGLHPQNHIQQAFFVQRRRSLRRTPHCLRSVTLVKADGDLSTSRLKGAIAPQEFLQSDAAEFIDVDPKDGFSVRNFQIQSAKTAMTSDIVVYGDDEPLVRKVAWDIANAQQAWRQKHIDQGDLALPEYNTFVCLSRFSSFEKNHPEIVAVDSSGRLTGRVVDIFTQERKEMYAMTKASEIAPNVFLGPTPDPSTGEDQDYDVFIECNDMGQLSPVCLQALVGVPDEVIQQVFLDFPSSGSILPPTWSQAEADGILDTCKWLYHLAQGTCPDPVDIDDDEAMTGASSQSRFPPRKILIHCQDGYTESTMLAIAYVSYATGMPVPEAWLHLHTVKKRNFFAYPTDVALLTAIAPRLLSASPVHAETTSLAEMTAMLKSERNEPKWLAGLDGSLPSRILDYMYLGNLGHANNPDLLRELGIGQILSVGETAMWRDGELEQWGPENVCIVENVQDNGIDPLTCEFQRCLEFIERGRRNGTATLVHCRVGVSRSATICIAEVMKELKLSVPRAYSFVRARRLNVIIQPHLRFAYELLKWEELLQLHWNGEIRRELEWSEITREIALMNRPYAR
ncbi:uncharacterized protein PpBr36_06252 [Pyricularia pennisetigena]|uniref:uncharacterized protein n=1 Tax=Pyricularia pennisetigena TaxID=1578925 RepID=UPI00114DB442|nr:uncharacterized protein PpBr36_06252 [Pyricularia pennisetigena]TLS22641.1 hypothetical protein PpBr36_06252 [Pyricularia pennisetigena]